jgi:hypothetical protein
MTISTWTSTQAPDEPLTLTPHFGDRARDAFWDLKLSIKLTRGEKLCLVGFGVMIGIAAIVSMNQ